MPFLRLRTCVFATLTRRDVDHLGSWGSAEAGHSAPVTTIVPLVRGHCHRGLGLVRWLVLHPCERLPSMQVGALDPEGRSPCTRQSRLAGRSSRDACRHVERCRSRARLAPISWRATECSFAPPCARARSSPGSTERRSRPACLPGGERDRRSACRARCGGPPPPTPPPRSRPAL